MPCARGTGRKRSTTATAFRVDFARWLGHVRGSNTEPIIRIIAEAATRERADEFVGQIQAIASRLLALSPYPVSFPPWCHPHPGESPMATYQARPGDHVHVGVRGPACVLARNVCVSDGRGFLHGRYVRAGWFVVEDRRFRNKALECHEHLRSGRSCGREAAGPHGGRYAVDPAAEAKSSGLWMR